MISAERGSRLAGGAAVVVIHILLIDFVLSGLPKIVSVPHSAHELILLLMPKQVVVKPPEKSAPRRAAIPQAAHAPYSAPLTFPAIAPSAPTELHIPSLRCAPENIDKLSPEERSQCGGFGFSPPDRTTVVDLRSHVRDPAQRAAELAARKTPARVDCTKTVTRVIQNMAQDNGVMVDTTCALGHVLRALGR